MGLSFSMCTCKSEEVIIKQNIEIEPNEYVNSDIRNNNNSNNKNKYSISQNQKEKKLRQNKQNKPPNDTDEETYSCNNSLKENSFEKNKEHSTKKCNKNNCSLFLEQQNNHSSKHIERIEGNNNELDLESKKNLISLLYNNLLGYLNPDKAPKISILNNNNLKGRKYINIIVLGSKKAGKTTFIKKFAENKFEENYIPSLGTESFSKNICFNQHNYLLNFFIPVTGEHKPNNKEFFKAADFFVIFYDITSIDSINNISNFLNELKEFYSIYEGISSNIYLIGNKCDLEKERKIDAADIDILIKKYNIIQYYTSAKTAKNINNFIQSFVETFDKFSFPQ